MTSNDQWQIIDQTQLLRRWSYWTVVKDSQLNDRRMTNWWKRRQLVTDGRNIDQWQWTDNGQRIVDNVTQLKVTNDPDPINDRLIDPMTIIIGRIENDRKARPNDWWPSEPMTNVDDGRGEGNWRRKPRWPRRTQTRTGQRTGNPMASWRKLIGQAIVTNDIDDGS